MIINICLKNNVRRCLGKTNNYLVNCHYQKRSLFVSTSATKTKFASTTLSTLSLNPFLKATVANQQPPPIQPAIYKIIRQSSSSSSSASSSSGDSSSSDFQRDRRAMGWWMLGCAGLVFVMVVVGGITRLTESGLSITEWKPLMGAVPPRTQDEWEQLFALYKQFPEYQKLRASQGMTLAEFKRIFFWEYAHRLLGRVIGVAFALPFAVFLARGSVSRRLGARFLALFSLGGAQGAVGWWMVKSGLSQQALDARQDSVPRVSHFRLCFHLTTAFAIYSGLLWTAMDLLLRPTTARLAAVAGQLPRVRRLALLTTAATGLTAMSGALVAGLDAGLGYNEWPLMGGRLVPADGWALEPWPRNLTSNPSLVQFEHRTLAYATVASVLLLQLAVWRRPRRSLAAAAGCSRGGAPQRPFIRQCSKSTRLALIHVGVMTGVQASLGVATLLSFVPVHLAATHQAGSLTLLSFALWLLHSLKKIR